MFNELYKNKQAFEIFLTIHVNFCCSSVSRPALRSKPLLDTMLWRTPASQKQYTNVDKGEDKKKYTIESTLKVSRYTFGHSDSTPSLSWHIESLRSSMSQSSLRENETFSRSEGIAKLIIMVWSVPNFRQEIRQSYCRNDNVKYDLDEIPTLFYLYMILWQICFV